MEVHHQPLVGGGARRGSAGRLLHPGQTPPDHRVPRHYDAVLLTPVESQGGHGQVSAQQVFP